MTSKKIDLGEYVVTIYYNDETGQLDVVVYDEGQEVIEAIYITNDEEDEEDEDEVPDNVDINLN